MSTRIATTLSAPKRHDAGRAGGLPMSVRAFLRTAALALLAVAMVSANVAAAPSRADLTPTQARQLARQALIDVKPALNGALGNTLPRTLSTLVGTGALTPQMAEAYRLVFIEGKAPANMPDVAHALSLPEDQRNAYVMRRLQEKGLLSAAEVKFFADLKAVPSGQVRGAVLAALDSGTFGPLGSSILQVAADLSSYDPNGSLQACDAARLAAADGFFDWVKGLVEAVTVFSAFGGLIGTAFGGAGGTIGAVVGGIAGAALYIADTTGGNGFMPGPNGEGCTGWPRPSPMF
ncbi:MAG TPA: hypothetical protein VFS43_02400 [Polyangiaceae bacterium]|nr:hypothetical protein [Polyangiaceae bacterium]